MTKHRLFLACLLLGVTLSLPSWASSASNAIPITDRPIPPATDVNSARSIAARAATVKKSRANLKSSKKSKTRKVTSKKKSTKKTKKSST
ncbi:MAG: hypothetical protein AB7E52_06295 [Bdellovibrionales bacterium]